MQEDVRNGKQKMENLLRGALWLACLLAAGPSRHHSWFSKSVKKQRLKLWLWQQPSK